MATVYLPLVNERTLWTRQRAPAVQKMAEAAPTDKKLKDAIQMKLVETGEYDRYDRAPRRMLRRVRPSATAGPTHAPPTQSVRLRRRRRLKELLRQRLIESQWRDQLKQYTMGSSAPPRRRAALAASSSRQRAESARFALSRLARTRAQT